MSECRHRHEFDDGLGRCVICTPPAHEFRGRDRSVAELREWQQAIESDVAGISARVTQLFEQLRNELHGA